MPDIIPERAQLSSKSFARFAEFITRELGIKMPEVKAQMLQSRLIRRLRELRIDTLDEYLSYLLESPDSDGERIHFINAVTTNKTDFFREPQHFEYLTRNALPALDPENRHRPSAQAIGRPWHLKLWCAGCSSGEEPYTQAIVLSEYAKERPGFEFSILATDVSTKVLEQAQLAIYEESHVEPVSLALRRIYFLRSKESAPARVRIAPELRKRIRFHRLNFMDDDYRVNGLFEVIFFRNVMIYFDKPTQERVINKLCRNLIPGGYLFVGHSESLAGLNIPVNAIGSAIYRKPW